MDQVTGNGLAEFIAQQPDGSFLIRWQGFDLWLVKQPWGELAVAQQGAQLLHFRPAGQAPVLWCSSQPLPAPKAIRGGVPLCWPWFGDHPQDSSKPAHGYARTAGWQLDSAEPSVEGGSWTFSPQQALCEGLALSLQIEVRAALLTLRMRSENNTREMQELSMALHSYFAISGRDQVSLDGIEGCTYADKLRDMAHFRLEQPQSIRQRTDRVFRHQGDVHLIDRGLQRMISIGKGNSNSTVVWNPGDLAAEMADIGMDQVDGFVCIETARTADFDQLALAPGEQLLMETRIAVSPLKG
ncbi:D-hexose-6-phosphate mutarotase [Marinobacterium jannaschii]|uniref:D-hexose-6-phosphate mutarotase n=1 Tax=Marinobacterium jannaschii TaxID=64970 RepID=UPI000B0E6551|nr:D-hexose-6-phosphate mutarotase [Marinobacterium jannaschii]